MAVAEMPNIWLVNKLDTAASIERGQFLGSKPDDDKLGICLAEDWKEKVRYFYSSWRIYQGGVWVAKSQSEIRRMIRQWLRDYSTKHGFSITQGRIRSLSDMMQDDLFVSDDLLMEKQVEQKRYVNLLNGLFDLEDMTLTDHQADLYFTTQLDFEFEEDADCPTFKQYLRTSLVHPDGTPDRSLQDLFCEALAYSMTARTDLKASFWLVGEKDSGKSTAIAMLKSLMGNLHATIDLTQLGTNRFLLAGIVGKRVVTFGEAEDTTILPAALYKNLTGGSDEIYADVKNREAIAFRPECKIWWAMNGMPRISDRSGATTRRIFIIPFKRTIPENKRIQDLEKRLASERSGIFNLMVNYYIRLVNQGGFGHCEQSEQMRKDYISENDTEATFIEECAECHESYKVKSSDLYGAYRLWCETNGFKAKNANQLAKEWRRLGFEHQHSNGKWWNGVRLLQII